MRAKYLEIQAQWFKKKKKALLLKVGSKSSKKENCDGV